MSNLTVEYNMVTRGLTWLSTTDESSYGMLVLPYGAFVGRAICGYSAGTNDVTTPSRFLR